MTEQESLRKLKIAALKSCDRALEKLRETNDMLIDQQTRLEETFSNNLERLLAVKIQFVEDQKKNIRKAKTPRDVMILVEVIATGLRKEQVA